MGWLFYNIKGKSRKTEMDSKYNWESEQAIYTVLKSSMVGSVYYAAVKSVLKDGSKTDVFAAVCLTSADKRNDMNFGYKDMDESVGPNEARCPVGILDLLTDPPPNEWAAQWRAKCRAYHASKKSKPKVGDTITLAAPVRFSDGSHESTFTVKERDSYRAGKLCKKRYYLGANGARYRLTGLERMDFTVTPAAQ